MHEEIHEEVIQKIHEDFLEDTRKYKLENQQDG